MIPAARHCASASPESTNSATTVAPRDAASVDQRASLEVEVAGVDLHEVGERQQAALVRSAGEVTERDPAPERLETQQPVPDDVVARTQAVDLGDDAVRTVGDGQVAGEERAGDPDEHGAVAGQAAQVLEGVSQCLGDRVVVRRAVIAARTPGWAGRTAPGRTT